MISRFVYRAGTGGVWADRRRELAADGALALTEAMNEWLKTLRADLRRAAERAWGVRAQRFETARYMVDGVYDWFMKSGKPISSVEEAVRALYSDAKALALSEIGADAPELDARFDAECERYLRQMNKRVLDKTRNELLRIIEKAEADGAEDLPARFEKKLASWDTQKAAGLAKYDAVNLAAQVAFDVYSTNGYKTIWCAGGNACPWCRQYNGAPIGGARALRRLPPLHRGCSCTVRAGRKTGDSGLTEPKKDDSLGTNWATADFQSDKATAHHMYHLREYGNISLEEYVQGARVLLGAAISNDVEAFQNNAGYVYKYRISENDFVIGGDGHIITRFKPRDGRDYWEREKNREKV